MRREETFRAEGAGFDELNLRSICFAKGFSLSFRLRAFLLVFASVGESWRNRRMSGGPTDRPTLEKKYKELFFLSCPSFLSADPSSLVWHGHRKKGQKKGSLIFIIFLQETCFVEPGTNNNALLLLCAKSPAFAKGKKSEHATQQTNFKANFGNLY